jgi:acyl-[acyl-carrier-protein]-phospholipid O-acyltransferase/long-chain-fatty-acid--[acyl-carrier-protein] ligase
VEEALQAAAGRTDRAFVVVNVKDDRTGQKLVVLHTKLDKTPEELRQAMFAAGVVRIRVPDAENFFEVDSLPLVGIGKPNYKAARVIAQERLAAQGRK